MLESVREVLGDPTIPKEAAGARVLEYIRGRFGMRSPALSRSAATPRPTPSRPTSGASGPTWGTSPPARLLSAADKLHNLRAIVADHRAYGDTLWLRFVGEADGVEERRHLTLWYYGQLDQEFPLSGGPRPSVQNSNACWEKLKTLTGGTNYHESNPCYLHHHC